MGNSFWNEYKKTKLWTFYNLQYEFIRTFTNYFISGFILWLSMYVYCWCMTKIKIIGTKKIYMFLQQQLELPSKKDTTDTPRPGDILVKIKASLFLWIKIVRMSSDSWPPYNQCSSYKLRNKLGQWFLATSCKISTNFGPGLKPRV